MSDMILLRANPDETFMITFELSGWLVLIIGVFLGFFSYGWWQKHRKRFPPVRLNIKLGGVGRAEFRPNVEDIQIAHRIWTELVTRKAALEIDPEHDVIAEIYDSWYVLFEKVRDLISAIPADHLRREKSTQQLVKIATDTLNLGLRPHLTKWQARFCNWYGQQKKELENSTPQEVQRKYPEYLELVADIMVVNRQLIQYAGELRKIVLGQ